MVIKWAHHKTSFMVYEKGIFLSQKESSAKNIFKKPKS